MNAHTNKELTQKLKDNGLVAKNESYFHFTEVSSQLQKLGLERQRPYFDGLVKSGTRYWQEWLEKWLPKDE